MTGRASAYGADQDATLAELRAGLEAFLSADVGAAVTVAGLEPVSSVGNAREPWSFSATWDGGRERCVLLAKAAAGQLETALRPEFATIAALAGTGVPVPRALWLDESGDWIGRPFFVTAWCSGSADTRALRRPEPQPWVTQAARELAVAASHLHAVPVDRFNWLAPCTVDDAARRQLVLWHEVFERQRLEPHPALVWAFAWLAARLPQADRVSVVHGDLRFGNLLADQGHLTALLDWEMVHLGDPVEDLSWVYRALWTPERSLPFEQFLAAYGEAGGRVPDPDHLRWYQVFAEVKHSMISLTAARSFADSANTSLRHADRAATVPAFLRRLWELVERVLNPTPIELLRQVAEKLHANVLPELAPGPARDELHTGIAILRRIARCLPTYRQFLHDDIADIAATLGAFLAARDSDAHLAEVEPLLARASALVPTVDALDDLVTLDLELRSVVAVLSTAPSRRVGEASDPGHDARLVPLLVRMTDREAALRLSPWER